MNQEKNDEALRIFYEEFYRTLPLAIQRASDVGCIRHLLFKDVITRTYTVSLYETSSMGDYLIHWDNKFNSTSYRCSPRPGSVNAALFFTFDALGVYNITFDPSYFENRFQGKEKFFQFFDLMEVRG